MPLSDLSANPVSLLSSLEGVFLFSSFCEMGCVWILCMVKWQMEVWEAGNLLLSLSVLLHRALITE